MPTNVKNTKDFGGDINSAGDGINKEIVCLCHRWQYVHFKMRLEKQIMILLQCCLFSTVFIFSPIAHLSEHF